LNGVSLFAIIVFIFLKDLWQIDIRIWSLFKKFFFVSNIRSISERKAPQVPAGYTYDDGIYKDPNGKIVSKSHVKQHLKQEVKAEHKAKQPPKPVKEETDSLHHCRPKKSFRTNHFRLQVEF
jgi:hypothetical protein